MNKGQESFKIVEDAQEILTDWVCQNLYGGDKSWLDNHYTVGFFGKGHAYGALIFSGYRPCHEVWWTIYAPDKRWCNRRVLRFIFHKAFVALKCLRISLLVDVDNKECLKFVQKLGFKKEGCLRKYRENQKDCYMMGMLKEECHFL